MSQIETVHLRLPKLTNERIIGHVSGLRPFRKGGLRLEEEQRPGLRILHNYGHGAWGVNLSYGTAIQIVDIFERTKRPHQFSNKPVIIIGGGVIGLSVALVLLERGYLVKLIASEMPQPYSYDPQSKHALKPLLTSQVAAGIIRPFSKKYTVNSMADKTSYRQFTKEEVEALELTYKFVQKSIETKRFKGLRYQKLFDFLTDCYETPGFGDDGRYVNVIFAQGAAPLRAHLSTAIIADTDYIQSLMDEVKKLGAEIINKKLKKTDLTSEELATDVIFNCSGLGAAELFDDQNMFPVKGQLIYFQKENSGNLSDTEQDFTFLADSSNSQDGSQVQHISHGDKLVIGAVFQQNVWHQGVLQKNIEDICRNYQNFSNLAVSKL